MAQYKIEYREHADGEVLRTRSVLASDVAEAEVEAKKEFTNIQVVGGALEYRILDHHGVVVAEHAGVE